MGLKDKKIIILLAVIVIIGLAFTAGFVFLPRKASNPADLAGASLEQAISDALNIKVKKIEPTIFSQDSFKSLKLFDFKRRNLNELKRNNKRPFEPPAEN